MRGRIVRRVLRRVVIGAVLSAAAFAFVGPARGADPKTIAIAESGPSGYLTFAGRTYVSFQQAFADADLPTIGVPIPGLETLSSVPVVIAADDTNHVVTLATQVAGDFFGPAYPNSPFGNVDVLLTGIWDRNDDDDTNPKVVLGVRAPTITLEQLFKPWADESPAGDTELANVVLALTSDDPITLNPAALPDAVTEFYDLDAPLELANTVNVVAKLVVDPNSAVIEKAAHLLGLDPSALAADIDIVGPLADNAALLFDRATGDLTDAADLQLDVSLPAHVPLAPLHDMWQMLGIEFADEATETLDIAGHVRFTMAALAQDGGDPSLDGLDVTLSGPAMTLAPPAPLNGWFADSLELTADAWNLALAFADDAVTFEATLSGVRSSLIDDPDTSETEYTIPFTFTALVDVLPGTNDFTAKLTASLDEPWQNPLEIPWLTVEDAGITATLSSVEGAVPSVLLSGRFGVAPTCVTDKYLGVALDIEGTEPPSATLTITLEDSVTIADMLKTVFGCDVALPPAAIADTGFSEGTTVSVGVNGETIRVDSKIPLSFKPYADKSALTADLLFSTDSAASRFTVGVRPGNGVMLSDLLPSNVALPSVGGTTIDLPITPSATDPNSGFGFVFSNAPVTITETGSSDILKDWFAPLFGGDPVGGSVPANKLSALGSFKLPGPLAKFMQTLGIEDHVLLSGSIPLPGAPDQSIDASLALEFIKERLPSVIEGGSIAMSMSADFLSENPSLGFGLTGTLTARMKQGVDPAVANTLAAVGVNVPRADPVPADPDPGDAVDDYCPRGGVRRVENLFEPADDPDDPPHLVSDDTYCFDLVDLSLGVGLTFQASPPAITVDLTGQIDPHGEWAPFGMEFIKIRQISPQVALSFTPTPPGLQLSFGGSGDLTVFDKDVSGAFQAGFSIEPAPPPAFVYVRPLVEKFAVRAAFPDGVARQDLLNIQAAAADVVGGEPFDTTLVTAINNAIPNISLRNLELSISPQEFPDLCIPLGLKFRADLFVDEQPGLDFPAPPECDPDTWTPGPSPSDSAQCADFKEFGCVAGVRLSLTTGGIEADGFLAGQNLAPFPVRFEDAMLQLRLTLQRQLLKISGGASVGPLSAPWASGRLAIDLQPSAMQLVGSMTALDFSALIDAKLVALDAEDSSDNRDHGPFDVLRGLGFDPAFEVHVVLADKDADFDESRPSFTQEIRELSRPVLDELEEIVELFREVKDGFQPGNYLDTIENLEDTIDDANVGFTVPGSSWLDEFADVLGDIETATAGEASLTLSKVLNGFTFGGVTVGKISCTGGYVDGHCVGITHNPSICPPPIQKADDGKCYVVPKVDLTDLGVCDLYPELLGLGTHCDVPDEILGAIQTIFEDGLKTVLGFGSESAVGRIFDTILAYLEDPGPLFDLECAEASVKFGLTGDRKVEAALDATIFGAQLSFGMPEFDFDPDDLAGSAAEMVEQFWRKLTGASPSPCEGADLELFGPDGIGAELEDVPPPVLNVSLADADINENTSARLTARFDREITADDGARELEINWGDGSVIQRLTVGVGDTATDEITHLYRDDNPSGTNGDTYTIVVDDTGRDGITDSAPVFVRNKKPHDVSVDVDATTISENDVASITVGFDDVGSLDTHKVRVQWGDGSVQTVNPATSGVVLEHRFKDDDPTETASDDYNVLVKVTDDDNASTTTSRTITVNNVAPSNITLVPSTVREGEPANYTVTFEDPGTRDKHTVYLDFDHDGTVDQELTVRAGARTIEADGFFPDDHPHTGTPEDELDVAVKVTDDDLGETSVDRTVVVQNVAPHLCLSTDPAAPAATPVDPNCSTPATRTITEGETISLSGAFADQGLPDNHEIVIDWGHSSLPDTVLRPAAGTRTFAAEQLYGDNGTFTITVTVTDDDTGADTATAPVEVLNVNPTTTIDETGTVLADGLNDDAALDTPTFLTRKGVNTSFSSRTTDPGSDDLTIAWDWDASNRYDTSVTSTRYRVNPPADDGLPSPTNQPRDVTDTKLHKWSQPCLYNVGATATDDDAGSAGDETWVVVTGTDSRVRAPGYWFNQYDSIKSNKNSINTPTLGCYLEVLRHMSRTFNSFRVVNTFDEARDALNTKQTSDAKEIMIRQLAASWLNFANGSIRWTDMVDTNRDGTKDAVFANVLARAEEVRINAASTRDELLAQENILQSVNGGA